MGRPRVRTPEKHDGWDIAAGLLRGAARAYAHAVEDYAITVALTYATGGLYLGYKGVKFLAGVVEEAQDGYRHAGVPGAIAAAINTVNPVTQFAVGVTATIVEAENGNYEEAGAPSLRRLGGQCGKRESA
jgi:hypothetical protein